jgi:hypothetical protein
MTILSKIALKFVKYPLHWKSKKKKGKIDILLNELKKKKKSYM